MKDIKAPPDCASDGGIADAAGMPGHNIIDMVPGHWIYLKLYLGEAIDRMDQLIVQLGQSVPGLDGAAGWFFIRYFDETGVHIRLRVRAQRGQESKLAGELQHRCANALNALHELLPSTYYPMVAPVGIDQAMKRVKAAGAHNDVQVVVDRYEPEVDKFGGVVGVRFAEEVFQVSSELACEILADEAQGRCSRKDLIPTLMSACFDAFMPETDAASFWREYSFYWLGGNSPAAGDWRDKFLRKGIELAEQGVAVVPERTSLAPPICDRVDRWIRTLAIAASRYREMAQAVDASNEVLSFNFAHLMNNRLGIAALEEAYMAALLEQRVRGGALSAAA